MSSKSSIYNIAILLDVQMALRHYRYIKKELNEIKSLERYARLQMYTVDGAGLSSDRYCFNQEAR